MVIIDVLNDFKEYMLADKRSINTIKNYVSDIKKMLNFVDKQPIELNKIDIIKYDNFLEENDFNAKTINRKLYAINKFIEFINDIYDLDISFNIKKIKMNVAKQEYGRNVLTKTDYKRILNAAIKDMNVMFVTVLQTMYLTGMRISEVLQIRTSDINKKEITVIGKGRKQRYVPIPKELNKQFRVYMKNRKKSKESFLFLNRKNDSRLNAWMCNYWIKKYARQTKVEIKRAHCHNIRHLFCYVALNERGMNIDEVAQLVGHGDINITKIYTNRNRQELLSDIKDFKLE